MTEVVYRLVRPAAPWSDYGEVLQHGISWHRPRAEGSIQLERTGPYIPPLSLPSHDHVVVTDAVRAALETSPLNGYRFLPVVKARIVRLHWTAWPPGPTPATFPSGGEPENYVLRRKHHGPTAEAMGTLWELTATVSAETKYGSPHYLLVAGRREDFFVGEDRRGLHVSVRAKEWLEERVPGCVAFEATLVA